MADEACQVLAQIVDYGTLEAVAEGDDEMARDAQRLLDAYGEGELETDREANEA